MYELRLYMPGAPDAGAVAHGGKALLVANALWFEEERGRGKTHPETAAALGLRRKPLPASESPAWRGAHKLRRNGPADCLEVVAYDGGQELASYLRRGFGLDTMLEAFSLQLVRAREPGARNRDGFYWHCRLISPSGNRDPSERLKPWTR